jgi:hypothetical protein
VAGATSSIERVGDIGIRHRGCRGLFNVLIGRRIAAGIGDVVLDGCSSLVSYITKGAPSLHVNNLKSTHMGRSRCTMAGMRTLGLGRREQGGDGCLLHVGLGQTRHHEPT